MADASDKFEESRVRAYDSLRSQLIGYVVAALATIVTTCVAVAISRGTSGGYVPPLIYVPGIVVAAAIGGLGPGLVATALAALAATYFLLLPVGFAIADPNDYVRLGFLIGVGILVSALLALTRRRREDIDEERERLRITLASIGDGVIRTDSRGRVTGLNGVASDLTGWDERAAIGQPLTEVFRIVNETTRATVDNPALRALREGRIVGLANHTLLLSKDGTERPIEDSAAPIRDAFGRIVGAVLVFRDVTADRRAAKAFRSIEARRAAMLESALDGIIAADADGKIIDFNPAAERIFGYSRSEALGRDMAELIIPAEHRDAHRSGLARLIATGEGRILNQRLELTAMRADGTGFDAELSIARSAIDESPIFVGYVRDITERKREESERAFFIELAAATQPLEDPAEVTQTAARLLAEHLQADRCAYAEVEDESIFVITGDYTRGVPSIVGRWPVEDFGAECVRSMLADEAYVVEDSEADPRIGPQDVPAYRATMIRSVICIPLLKGGKFTAAMAVHQKTVRRWSDHEIAFVRTVVDRCWEALQRSSAVRQLRESEERYRSLVTATSAIVWDSPASGEFETPQPSWSEFTGQTFQQFFGWGWLDAVHPDDRAETAAAWKRALGTSSQYVVEHRLRRADGEYRDMSVRGIPILDATGEVREWVGIHEDVTERKRASEALRQSEERYRTLFEQMDEGFCVAEVVFDDPGRAVDYRFLEANPAFEKHSGLSNVVGKTAGELVPGHEAYWAEIYGEVARTGKPVRFVNEAQRLNRWFDVNAFRIGGEGSVRVAQIFTDITERKRADAELRESEERFRRMADDAPVMIWVTDPDGVCTYLSKSWFELTGQTPETGLGFGWVNATHPDDQKMVHDAFVAANAARAPFHVEYRLRRADGDYGWFIDAATPRFDANGAYLGYIGSVVDITERRRIEQERQEHEERFRTLVEQVEDYAIFMIDREGRPTSWNEGVRRVLGFDEEEFIGQNIDSIFTPEDLADDIPDRELTQAAATGRSNNDRWMRRKDGTRFYATGVTNSLKDGRDRLLGYMKVMRDQTERKQMEDELRRVAADLSEADRRKNEFLATLAHELRNPLAPIRSGLELLRLTGDDPQETAEIRDVMERQAQQMMRLIDDLLEVARITQGKLELRTATVTLSDIVRSAVDASRPFVDEGGHELTVSVPSEPVRLVADPHRLQQVFSNLLNNAAKYTPDGGRIELTASLDEEGVAVVVRDNGIGIPAEMKDRIFEMFAQIDRSMERSYSGLGIGLTLVKRLVEMHGGRIEVHSEGRNQGSEFVVHLPTEQARTERETTDERPDADAPSGGLRVLVVDDNRPAADILAKVIRLLGNEARTAYDGREGVAVADEFRPEVILMDLGMPNMNGYEATREIRRFDWGGGVTIVALTGWGQDEDRRRTEEAGFDRHLVKPVEPSTLQKLLAETRKNAAE